MKYDPSLQYKQLLGNFKTLFPKYVLTNDQIQKAIQRSNSKQFEAFDPNAQRKDSSRRMSYQNVWNHNFDNKGYIANQMNEQSNNDINNESDLVDDFIFSESDTIGTVIHSEYS